MDYNEIKKIIQDMGESKIDTLEIEFPDGLKIKMDKGKNNVETSSQNTQVIPVVSNEVVNNIKTETKQEEEYKIIKSPMVGTFYSKSSPKAEPFVKVGDKVKKGQVVCIVEAMKLMNEIEAEFEGEIVEVCKKDEDMVEYGTTLFKLK